mmetsp:Transcript_28248/g.60168  ORF Transcript_28248/g.60168 Transcript_28248/m.60168 type:complete len:206 (-) Transcript_28248:365-982(-)
MLLLLFSSLAAVSVSCSCLDFILGLALLLSLPPAASPLPLSLLLILSLLSLLLAVAAAELLRRLPFLVSASMGPMVFSLESGLPSFSAVGCWEAERGLFGLLRCSPATFGDPSSNEGLLLSAISSSWRRPVVLLLLVLRPRAFTSPLGPKSCSGLKSRRDLDRVPVPMDSLEGLLRWPEPEPGGAERPKLTFRLSAEPGLDNPRP